MPALIALLAGFVLVVLGALNLRNGSQGLLFTAGGVALVVIFAVLARAARRAEPS